MRIEVTTEHIEQGTRGDPESCAIGLAVTEAVRRELASDMFVYVEPIEVNGGRIEVYSGDPYGPRGLLYIEGDTAALVRFMERFDRGAAIDDLEPFGFDAEWEQDEDS